ncbi:MAG: Gfo/Idh/MocA family oxidoreductase [Armatimonadetes bacterium]|nr:Gfo/Idh/MocA family oxidoreductase [Armatimonadota bacterium]
MERLRLGVIGCGAISARYLENLTRRFTSQVEVLAVADLLPEAAAARAAEYGVPRACTPDELLADDAVEMVVNLTNAFAHYEVNLAALRAGKHVFTEKPLAATAAEGRLLLAEAAMRELTLGGAPDTFLGAGLQTCRKLIDDGWLGELITSAAFFAFGVPSVRYHRRGAGPMFDLGVYYLTALVALLGPVTRVSGSTASPRVSEHDPAEYEMPGLSCGTLDFACGVRGVITATAASFGYQPRLELWGSEANLTCPDPNMFGGPVVLQPRHKEPVTMPLSHGFDDNSRGLAIADMACAIRFGRPARAGADLIFHVLEVMDGIHRSSDEGRHVAIESTCERPAPLAAGLTRPVLEA